MKNILATALALALVALTTTSIFADTISIGASKDTTIFQNNVNNSSGGGNGLFAGTNGASSPRRALIAFDIAGSIPAGSIVQSVQLTLALGQVAGGGGGTGGVTGMPFIDLFRLTRDWGEGTVQSANPPSDSLGGQGQGAGAGTGDATWNAAAFAQTNWTTPGGDFANPLAPSATTQITGTTLNVPYSWNSTAALEADVQGWLANSTTNFGWILKNQDETSPQTFRAFFSRSVSTASLRPSLTITYAVPEPATLVLTVLAAAGVFVLPKCRACRFTHEFYPTVGKKCANSLPHLE